ncbi:MAG: hypothetical protein HY233_05015 [Acidobacteriales bacterium]|nr:hypothetical protein [Terriglobales bacterium]
MNKINWNRVILGGLAAGLIINLGEYLVNGVILQQHWAEAMKQLGKPGQLGGVQIAAFNVAGFLMGIYTIWLYAAIRPRYGAGPKTAVCAGAAVWGLGYLLAGIAPLVTHILPRRLMAIGIAVGLIEVIVAALAGAWFYREEAA